jgi:hypothetical protein
MSIAGHGPGGGRRFSGLDGENNKWLLDERMPPLSRGVFSSTPLAVLHHSVKSATGRISRDFCGSLHYAGDASEIEGLGHPPKVVIPLWAGNA